jgi:hypothetical protein
MSEESRAERFGHAVIHTELAEVYVLDLYERPELVFEGIHLPPFGYVSDLLEREEPRRGPSNIVMRLDDRAVHEVRRALDEGGVEIFEGRLSIEAANAELWGRIESTVEMPGRTVWTGDLGGKAWHAGGTFNFVIEQYGTTEIVLLLLLLFLVVFSQQEGAAEADCYRRAAEVCGEGRIRSVSVVKRLTGTTLRVETECQFECVEHDSGG